MIETIKDYYEAASVMHLLLKRKIAKFEAHKDIAEEFAYWITHKKYKESNCISVEGYTASILANTSKMLDGEAAFLLLIELREEPEKALKRIKSGFKIK